MMLCSRTVTIDARILRPILQILFPMVGSNELGQAISLEQHPSVILRFVKAVDAWRGHFLLQTEPDVFIHVHLILAVKGEVFLPDFLRRRSDGLVRASWSSDTHVKKDLCSFSSSSLSSSTSSQKLRFSAHAALWRKLRKAIAIASSASTCSRRVGLSRCAGVLAAIAVLVQRRSCTHAVRTLNLSAQNLDDI